MPLKNYEKIVTHFAAPTLVLAGPGAGKTYLLGDRVKRLLSSGVDKDNITVLTFGRDANRHMREELINPKGFNIPSDNLPHISTMHSLGLSIVQEKPRSVDLRKTDLQVQNEEEVKRLLFRDAALILGYTEDRSRDASKCKSCGDCSESPGVEYCAICAKYREIMSKCNYIDFDDQIHFACKILETSQNILDKYQSQAEHLLVDEYQDINAAQFKLIELLSKRNRKGLFVVGDDAQSIYGFRGGDPKFILRFEHDFPGAEIAPLAHSRRCHENIMEPSFKVLEKYYLDWSGKPDLEYHKEKADPPYLWHLSSEDFEAKIAAAIAHDAVLEKKTVLILAPKKEFFPLLLQKLTKNQVPYNCSIDLLPERVGVAKRFIDWVKKPSDTFLTRLVIEDLINTGAIAAVAGASKDRRSKQSTIANRIAEETNIAELWGLVDKDNDLFSVVKDCENGNNTLETIKNSLNGFLESYNGYKNYNRGEFAKQLASIPGIWTEPPKMAEDIANVVEIIKAEQPFGSSSAQILTMRKAKGLEAQVVIIIGLEDDIIPNPKSSIDEEARLLYVSMTRAKEKLYLFHSFKRPRNISYGPELVKKGRSRFLDALGRKSEFKKPKQG